MTPEKLQEMYYYAWNTFYASAGHSVKMGQLFMKAVQKEKAIGTYQRFDPQNRRSFRRGTAPAAQ
jgi:hypothetical protein